MSPLWAMPVATLALAATAVVWTTARLAVQTNRLGAAMERLESTRLALLVAADDLRRIQDPAERGGESGTEHGR